MNLGIFLNLIENNPNATLRFLLPDYNFVEKHFHVTEIGKVTKDFIDCGGTYRNKTSCLLQLWVANDEDHQVDAGKLCKIFSLASHLKLNNDLPIEVQYGLKQAIIYDVANCRVGENFIDVILTSQKTDCLAPDKCGIKSCATSCCNNSRCC